MTPDVSISAQDLQYGLRMGLPFVAVASIVMVVGIVSIVLSRLRSRDRLLVWLGVLAIAYAARLLFDNDLVRLAFGANQDAFRMVRSFLTYLIAIPYACFARELLGSGWKHSLSIWLWIEAGFAVLAIPLTLFAHQGHRTEQINNSLIIGGTLLVLLNSFLQTRSDAVGTSLRVPLIVFGVMVLLNNLGVRPKGFQIEPFGFLVLLSGLIYAALRRVVKRETKLTEVEQELATARRIQMSILPRALPALHNLSLASRYEPMTSMAGDFYDFIESGEHSLTILVADVSGHGVPAALVASMLKTCFLAQREQAKDPARVLAGFNVMLRDVLVGQYVTAACAAIDLSLRTVTYAGAGHPPALLLRENGELVKLEENGLFIGPFPQATYTSVSVPFGCGDKLLLYTDGIVEATVADGEQFGQGRLIEFLRAGKNLAPRHFVDDLFTKVSGGLQEDDLTAVLAKFE